MSDRPVTPPPAPLDRRAALVGGALLAVFAAVAIGLLVLALGGRDPVRGCRRRIPSRRRARRPAGSPGARARRPARGTVRADRPRRSPGARVLRLHALPGCLSGDGRRAQRGAGRRGTGRARGVRLDRSRPRRPGRDGHLPQVPPRGVHRPVRHARGDRQHRGGVGREVREGRRGNRRRLRDGPHRGRVPRRCRRAAFGPDSRSGRRLGRSRPRSRACSRSAPPRRRPLASARPPRRLAALAGGSGPGDDLRVLVVSSSIWAGPETPVIVTLTEPDGTPLDGVAGRCRPGHRRERDPHGTRRHRRRDPAGRARSGLRSSPPSRSRSPAGGAWTS